MMVAEGVRFPLIALTKNNTIMKKYVITFGFLGDDDYIVTTSKPIPAADEESAMIMLQDQFESHEGIHCDIIAVKEVN